MLKKIIEAICRVHNYIWGNIFAIFLYKKKYLQGIWFVGNHGRLFAPGWKWVFNDAKERILFGKNKKVPWPISGDVRVVGYENIYFDNDDLNNFQGVGNYFQAMGGKIIIGKGTWIAAGVGIITSNHDINNPNLRQEGKDIIIGEKCWIGMNAIILPGVKLGPHTTVGAGAVVTKSFEKGYCVIAGNPARLIKTI